MGRFTALVAATFAVFIMAGPAQARIATPAHSFHWTAESNKGGAYFGISVASAGDVNGDGFADVVVGAYGFNSFQGRAYLYMGSASGLRSVPSWIAEPDQANVSFGYSMASAGDVNGDGYDDVLVGAYNYSHGETDEGRVFLYFGSPTGPGAVPDWTAESDVSFSGFAVSVASGGDVNGDGYDDVLVGADSLGRAYMYLGSPIGPGGTPDWTADGQTNSFFGHSVASAGDVNGDGYDDVVVGARYYDHGQDTEGQASVYLGSSSGLGSAPAWTAESNQAEARFGSSVASAGDANGDGYDDVLVGAPGYDCGQLDCGRAYLYLGSAAGLGALATWTAETNKSGSNFGDALAPAGDIDGDGHDDAVIGSPELTNGELWEGGAFVFLGSTSGLSSHPAFAFESNQQDARAGVSVASAGDVNGDGFADVILGSYYYDHGQVDEGAAIAWYGGARHG